MDRMSALTVHPCCGILTLQSQLANGKPRSRANANICLDAVATLLIALQRVNNVIMQVMIEAPACDPVAL